MKKILTFCKGLIIFSLVIALGLFVLWAAASAFVVRYLFKSKGKYENYKEFLKEGKNITAVIVAIILLVVIPVNYIKTSKEYEKENKIKQEQQAILDEQKNAEAEQKKAERERASVLNAKSRLKKEKKKGNDIHKGIILTEEEIEKHNITEEEIEKFNSDVEKAIIAFEEEDMALKYKQQARKYVKQNLDYVSPEILTTNYNYSEDKTICTISGRYKSKNVYGVNVRGEYSIEFDTSTGEIVGEFIGNEKVSK